MNFIVYLFNYEAVFTEKFLIRLAIHPEIHQNI